MAKRKRPQIRKVKTRKLRAKYVRSLAKETKGGKGRIKKRSGYRTAMR